MTKRVSLHLTDGSTINFSQDESKIDLQGYADTVKMNGCFVIHDMGVIVSGRQVVFIEILKEP